jgi:16S rRNA (cytidine1402-2'-O)-methyltransferase
MASGMNGQCFQFNGYLPIDSSARKKAIKEFEAESSQKNCTYIFIETPYRNNQLLNDLLVSCNNETKICTATDITASTQSIVTKRVMDWKKLPLPELHKRPTIFLLQG